jgi:hypothetical protein
LHHSVETIHFSAFASSFAVLQPKCLQHSTTVLRILDDGPAAFLKDTRLDHAKYGNTTLNSYHYIVERFPTDLHKIPIPEILCITRQAEVDLI